MVLRAEHILIGQGIPVLIHINRLVDGNFRSGLFLGPEIHQDFVLNALARIGGEAGAVADIEGVDGLYKTYGPNGNQILLIFVLGIILANNVRHQAQIVFNQLFPCLAVPRPCPAEISALFFGRQRRRKAVAVAQMQDQIEQSSKDRKNR